MSGAGASSGARKLTTLYRDAIRRHASEPIGFQRPIRATHTHEAYNALCGDRVHLQLRIDGATVIEAAFDGEACAICTASASLLCSLAPGESVARLRCWAQDLAAELTDSVGADSSATGGNPEPVIRAASARSRMNTPPQSGEGESQMPEALRPLLGVRPYPSRVRCATLPWEAAIAALDGT